MDPRRWEEIQTSFDEIVELDASERAGRLAVLTSTDPELRRALESLLAADAQASARLAPLEAAFLLDARVPTDALGLAGRTISHFEVGPPLGAGGMGVVYRAQDTHLGRAVALKFLLPQYNFDDVAKARFLREAHSAAALDHPSLCTIHEVGTSDDGWLFLAMPLYQGETLKARIAREGVLPLSQALPITRQIAQGLSYAHAAGIVHRDLKPGNVMLLPDGTVKVLDFGLAKARDQSISETGARFGTVSYMAPEQILGETVDGRTDLWALGVVLYEMLTGRKPFAGENESAIAHAVLHDQLVPPSSLRQDVPAAAEDLLLTLLQKDPAARYSVVDELLSDLIAVGTTVEQPPASSGRPRRVLTSHVRHARRRRVVWGSALLVLSVVGYTAIASSERGWLRLGSPAPVSRYSIALPDGEAMADAGFRAVLMSSNPSRHRIAISPDGEHLVYVGSADVNHRLWLRKRDQLHATSLTGTEDAINPFFSPDGSRVGFVSTRPPRAVKTVSLRGDTPSTVTDSLVDLGGAAWACGYIYFDGRLEGDGVTRIPETGGRLEAVTVTDYANGEWWHFQPEPLPNCKGALFVVARGGDAREATIAVVDLESRTHRALVRGISPRYAASGHLLYVRADGTLMAVAFDQDKLRLAGEPVALAEGLGMVRGVYDLAVSASGTFVYTAAPSRAAARELVWVDRDANATPIDSGWRAGFTSVALSPDGKGLAVGIQDDGNNHVWIKRLDRAPAKLTLEGDFHDRPAWTADGRAVVFVSRGRQNWDLYQRPVDGSAPPQLLLDEVEYLVDAEYSRDGKWLLYQEAYTLFAARMDEDRARIRLVEFPSDASTPRGSLMRNNGQYTPRLSPDGRWLAYTSDEEMTGKSTGRDEVYVRPFPNTGGAKWRVSVGGGYEPRWSRDGRELYYKNFRGDLVAATVLLGGTFAVGEQRVLFSTEGYLSNYGFRTYDVAPDGRFVMIRPTKQAPDELIWVENFFQELKAKVKR